ncbi:MAG: SDR family oxidoreductase [Actinobacteria bacterium]|nr:SDR family oxidoreductase [Actinomycetota bacterium]
MTDGSATLVVGGASGIGLASARAIGAEGRRLVLADRDAAALDRAVESMRGQGLTVEGRQLDVTDVASVDDVVAAVAAEHGLGALVNTAGILQLGTVLDVTDEDWDRMLTVNLRGAFFTCRAAVRAMRASGGGVIVNLTSQSGRTKSFYSAPNYVAAKAGVIGLTMSIAAQHAAEGIRANAVAPGIVETPMTAEVYTAEQRAAMQAATPMGRFASADELAAVVAFLASPRSSYVTGQTINVNGGSFMQ